MMVRPRERHDAPVPPIPTERIHFEEPISMAGARLISLLDDSF